LFGHAEANVGLFAIMGCQHLEADWLGGGGGGGHQGAFMAKAWTSVTESLIDR
jgi:hypothetical protein